MKWMTLFLIPFFHVFCLEEQDLVWEEKINASEYKLLLDEALAKQNWWGVIDYAEVLSYNFPTSTLASEASFLSALAYLKMEQYEQSNLALTAYLDKPIEHKHLDEAVEMKFKIASAFANGAKARMFGSHKAPALLSSDENAIAIFDEIIHIIPFHEIAAKSLLGKAKIQAKVGDFKVAIETLTQLIRKFPKSDYAAEAYLRINEAYLLQAKDHQLDQDLLDLASLNLRKFMQAFPSETRLDQAKALWNEMEELFAQNLLDVGKFFEKTKKASASKLYYKQVISKYPGTKASNEAKSKLNLE
jgi:outer membrane assembly lipoprotein YfiO